MEKSSLDFKVWITKVRLFLAVRGFIVGGVKHTFDAIITNNLLSQTLCPKCGHLAGFEFRSRLNKETKLVACRECNKFAVPFPVVTNEEVAALFEQKDLLPHCCSANTKAGQRCKNRAVVGSEFCRIHSS